MNSTWRIIAIAALSSALVAGILFALPSKGQAAASVSINSCTTISSPGHYELVANLTSAVTCISINASHVKLKLNGHTITGPSGGSDGASGITVVGVTHVDIEGPGVITNFGRGVDFGGVDFSEVKGVTAIGNFFGFIVNGIPNNRSEKNWFRGNTATGNNQHGFTQNGASDNNFLNNVASNNGANGFEVLDGTSSQLKENTTNGNGGAGIRLGTGSIGNSVRGNTAQSNSSVDLADDNPNCDNNVWMSNVFNTANQACIQ